MPGTADLRKKYNGFVVHSGSWPVVNIVRCFPIRKKKNQIPFFIYFIYFFPQGKKAHKPVLLPTNACKCLAEHDFAQAYEVLFL